jgi:glycerol kinase
MAGAIIDWLKNNLQVFDNFSELQDILNNNSINTEIVMVPAFTGLGAPHWKPNSRASISGLTRDSNRNDIITSSVQSISLQTHDLIKAINEDTSNLFENPISSIKVDGGLIENDWFIQNLSDICNIKISKSNEQEATALGAASLSALGSKEIKNLREFNIKKHKNTEFTPKIEKKIREEIIENWNLALNKTISV